LFSGGLNNQMAKVTRVALRALEQIGGPRVVLAAVPGGARAVADAAGVSVGRVSQVLRSNPLPPEWAVLLARLADCCEWEIYAQLGQGVTGSDTARDKTAGRPGRHAHGPP